MGIGTRQATKTVEERFWEKTRREPGGCLTWTAYRTADGYGQFSFNGRRIGAHRAAWMIFTGEELTSHQCILHNCDNPPCVEITHLRVGTSAENTAEKIARGRSFYIGGERHGAARIPEETIVRIRLMLAEGMTHERIAAEVGCSRTHITNIKNGKTRREPSPEPTKLMISRALQRAKTQSFRDRQLIIAKSIVHPADAIPGEEWRPTRFPGYWVSSLARVRGPRGTILKQTRGGGETRSYYFVQCGARNTRQVHWLVCEAFHGPRPDGMLAAHNDGNSFNNLPENLRWATPTENQADRRMHGRLKSGSDHPQSKLTEMQVGEIRGQVPGPYGTLERLAREFGVSPTTIARIRDGKR
ncbi:HNH endonuclease [Pseudarthrobacter sp. IC2-21]|uniref:HNH endonuclease n=1 Tax=Pseudarthrobacter sp. IC2-21 TaxID=3092262 RepID=UPI002A6AADB7|nr:HNH endonuclease [Pseudarthrobacter sp. IC2-21]